MKRYGLYYVLLVLIGLCFSRAGAAHAEEASPSKTALLVSKEAPTQTQVKTTPEKSLFPLAPVKKIVKKKVVELDDPKPDDLKMKGEVKKMQGVVSASSTGGVAVEYGVTADGGVSEMWLPFTKAVKFTGYKNYTDIQYEDRVEVVFKEAKNASKRFLQEVKLLSRKPKENKPVMELVDTQGAAKADENT